MFKDVPAKHWARGVIMQAAEQGWVSGFADGTFHPDAPVTRAQAVSMISRATVYMHNRIQAVISECKPAVVKVVSGNTLGTGSIITADGYVLTNEHVVMDQSTRVFYPDLQALVVTDPGSYEETKAYPIKVIATSNFDDLALVKIDASGLPSLHLAEQTPAEGTAVVVMGHPYGFQYTSSVGIVTQDVALLGGLFPRVQTDAAINPGNSGGPMVDLAGRMIAVTEAKVANADNMGFGIRIEDVRNFLNLHVPGKFK